MEGKAIIVSAPSGAGKTTIVKHLLSCGLPLEFSVSACSRPNRQGEVNGKDYYFLGIDEFRRRIDNNEFVEWEEVYPGMYYGTLKSEINRIWEMQRHVVFDVDVKGGVNLKRIFGDRGLSLFIGPPSFEALRDRLVGRGTENPETLEKRLDRARLEMEFASRFDKIIINESLELAFEEAERLVRNFLVNI